MKIIKPGSKVLLKDNIEAMVLSIQIGPLGVTYECSWWVNGDRKIDWISPCEMEAVETGKIETVGFKDEHKRS